MADAEDRTEAASARRLQQARQDGRVPVSRELAPLAVLSAAALVLMLGVPSAAPVLAGRLALFLGQADRLDPLRAIGMAVRAGAAAAAPFVVAALLAGAAAVLLQTGFLFNLAAAAPDLARLDPRRGLGRVFGIAPLLEAGKSLLKLAVVACAIWQGFAAALAEWPGAMLWQPATLADHALRRLLSILLCLLAAQAGIATLDVMRARLRHARTLRMSRHELQEEHRESDGDPRMKARLRKLRAQRARRRMMQAVPRATLVLTNPTHYAVALAYDRAAGGAPVVVAKGMDEMAARIRALAESSRVPVIANPPLARALFRVELDHEIPAEHYRLVAELIAYVWRLRGRRARAG